MTMSQDQLQRNIEAAKPKPLSPMFKFLGIHETATKVVRYDVPEVSFPNVHAPEVASFSYGQIIFANGITTSITDPHFDWAAFN
jgi:hypothetical protein